MKMLCYPALDAAELRDVQSRTGAADVLNARTRAQALDRMAEAEAFYGHLTPELLARARRLRWVQAPLAGLENYIFPALAQSDVILTNMAGIYSDMISDHALTYVLMFARGFHLYRHYQAAHAWLEPAPVRHLSDCVLGVLGLGGIGAEVARKGKALGLRVLGVEARSIEPPPGVDEMVGPQELDSVLPRTDFLVVCVPHTPRTVGLIGRRELDLMPASAFLINVGRGVVVKLADLTQALRDGTVAGAGLDVFETEPLPPAHPLWSMRNVILTPHAAAAGPHVAQRRRQVLIDNINRWQQGRPLHNEVDKQRWFLKDAAAAGR